jgi:hypothetical protein
MNFWTQVLYQNFDHKRGFPNGQEIEKENMKIDFIFNIVVWERFFECVADSVHYLCRTINFYHHQFDPITSNIIPDFFPVTLQFWSIDRWHPYF